MCLNKESSFPFECAVEEGLEEVFGLAEGFALLRPQVLVALYAAHFRRQSNGTQSPGARSYCQKVHPLHVRRLQAAAPANDGAL